jgi:TrmH family RNA methyltransferase
MIHIHSRDNPLVKALRRHQTDPAAYRRSGWVVLEGDHLCEAWRASPAARTTRLRHVILSESRIQQVREDVAWGNEVIVMPDTLIASISALETAPEQLFVVDLPTAAQPLALTHAPTVVLDRLQDPGNVGSILRSAAAFGVTQVLAIKGTAALWSPKVLRAGQGAHFALSLMEVDAGWAMDALVEARLPIVATSSHAEVTLGSVPLPSPLAWVFGHEGQGVDGYWLDRARSVRIPQTSQESLNVAAAAAICLFHSSRGRP